MTNVTWQIDDNKNARLIGVLSRETVPSLWRELQHWSPTESSCEISLEAINYIDSAGMALLIQLITHAKNRNCHIMYHFVPKQLMMLIELSQISGVFQPHLILNIDG